jgi:hypothetical protein
MNHDGFPAEELAKSYLSMVGKGFYIEHASFDPRNAIGILAHAQWYPEEQYVVAVALVDKMRFPQEAEMIRRGLQNGKGVSIGCIAGTAECSICHKIAKKKQDLCAHLTRGNPFYAKGKIIQAGHKTHSICRDLTFYELSYVRNPADRDALSIMVSGAEEATAPVAPPVDEKKMLSITMPNDQQIEVMVNDAVKDAFKLRVKKLIKDEVYRQFEEKLRKLQVSIKPDIRDKVEEKKDEVTPATEEEKGGDKKNELESKV